MDAFHSTAATSSDSGSLRLTFSSGIVQRPRALSLGVALDTAPCAAIGIFVLHVRLTWPGMAVSCSLQPQKTSTSRHGIVLCIGIDNMLRMLRRLFFWCRAEPCEFKTAIDPAECEVLE